MNLRALLSVLTLLLCRNAFGGESVVAANVQATRALVSSADATAAEKTAAKELAGNLSKANGGTFPQVAEAESRSKTARPNAVSLDRILLVMEK